ncbi:hypothetical protein EWX78_07095 [Campylobacter coli]|uniref:Uncharacterized protein n=1 Tax=Campylobacter coli TaxID=195 RepID=A0A644SA64_CAMCO|nr:hypothetical protein [Campylobacter coli]EAI3822945.1 hypothetical protein [Campylobacter coli]EAI5446318.1 hypothetical protein [Campylobacter coli]EAJ2630297.1 hypothetical protein [Campylobacter coli]EAJ9198107.1 hypothetical protein [Campylobacter coli]
MKKYLFLALSACSFLQASNNAATEGNSFGSQLNNYFKSNADSAINSLTNGGEIRTVDGKQKANVQMACEESKSGEFLNIDYTGTSDINIQIRFDKNVDGRVDKIWSFDNVSGICTDGLVKCDKNSWNNCEYFQYSYGDNINLVKTTIDNLNGCYCINSSCGSVAAKNRDKILYDIAGPIYSALSAESRLVLSKATKVGSSLSYRGQDYSVCDNYGESVNVNSSSNLEGLGQELAASQSNNENSTYSIFYKGTDNKTAPKDEDFNNKIYNSTVSIDQSAKYSKGNSKIDFSYMDTTSGKNVSGDMQSTPDVNAKFCEVKIAKEDTSAFNDGTNRENSTNNTIVYQSEIRECTNNWTKCPINSKNETLKYDCGKINDMGEALAQLSAIDEASKDMVCSK